MPQYVEDMQIKLTTACLEFRAVKLSTTVNQEGALATGTNDEVIGICQATVTATDVDATHGRIVAVRVHGIARCTASAAIARGDRVQCFAAVGKLRTIPASQTGAFQVGIALTAAAADGDLFDVLLTPGAKINVA